VRNSLPRQFKRLRTLQHRHRQGARRRPRRGPPTTSPLSPACPAVHPLRRAMSE